MESWQKFTEIPRKCWEHDGQIQLFYLFGDPNPSGHWMAQENQMDPSGMTHPAIAIPPSSYQNAQDPFLVLIIREDISSL